MKFIKNIRNVKNVKRKLIIAGIVVVVVLGGANLMYQSSQPVAVDTVQIGLTDFEEYHIEEGVVEAAERVNVYSPESETVRAIFVEEGQVIKAGETLYQLEFDGLQYELDKLMAQKESTFGQSMAEEEAISSSDIQVQVQKQSKAKRIYDSKKADFESNQVLFESGAISKDALAKIEDEYQSAKANYNIEIFTLKTLQESQSMGSGKSQYYKGLIDGLDIQIQQIEERIMNCKVIAPIDGIISDFDLKVGDRLMKDSESLLILNKSEVEVVVYTSTKSAKQLFVGDTAFVEVEDQNDFISIKGEIKYIASAATDVVSPLGLTEKKVKVIVAVKDSANLLLGEKLDVKFVTFSKLGAKVISRDYIFPWGDGEGVWVIADNKAQIMRVDKNYENASKIILSDATSEDLRLIVPPFVDTLEEGLSVTMKE